MKTLIFTDFDGVLTLPEGKVNKETFTNRYKAIILTGRDEAAIEQTFDDSKLWNYTDGFCAHHPCNYGYGSLITFSGADISHNEEGIHIHRHYRITPPTIDTRKIHGLLAISFLSSQYGYAFRDSQCSPYYSLDNICFLKDKSIRDKIDNYYKPCYDSYSKYKELVNSIPPVFQVMIDSLKPFDTTEYKKNYYVEQFPADGVWVTNIRHKSATKQKAIQYLLAVTESDRAIHIGDNVNDIMTGDDRIQVYAVNNACDALKNTSDVIILDSTSEGNPIKEAIEREKNNG